jgi:LacI family transcriptional regulator
MLTRPRIAVLVESSRGYGRGLLQGIAAYVREHGPWTVDIQERRLYDAAPKWLRHWRGDGIIARIASPPFARQLGRLRLPTVDLAGLHRVEGVPVIITDHQAVVRLAADHLLSLGLRQFAFCGFGGIYYSQKRGQYFAEYLAVKGHTVHVFSARSKRRRLAPSALDEESAPPGGEMAAWLRSLPKPVGLLAVTDNRGHQVLNICGEHGVAVPDEVAVIGVDNDEMLCDLCEPPLSSVALNPWKVGYEGAALLDRMLQGNSPPRERTLIPPLGVVTRRSTDVVTLVDADLAAALRLIRERACGRITIEDVLREVPISRSTLKRRFATILRRSPHEEIRRVQLQRVMQLLSTTRLPLAKIAQMTGFLHIESMCRLFKQKTDVTPGRYRKMWSDQGFRGG